MRRIMILGAAALVAGAVVRAGEPQLHLGELPERFRSGVERAMAELSPTLPVTGGRARFLPKEECFELVLTWRPPAFNGRAMKGACLWNPRPKADGTFDEEWALGVASGCLEFKLDDDDRFTPPELTSDELLALAAVFGGGTPPARLVALDDARGLPLPWGASPIEHGTSCGRKLPSDLGGGSREADLVRVYDAPKERARSADGLESLTWVKPEASIVAVLRDDRLLRMTFAKPER